MVVRLGKVRTEYAGCIDAPMVDLDVLVQPTPLVDRRIPMVLNEDEERLHHPGRIFKVVADDSALFAPDGASRHFIMKSDLQFFGPLRQTEIADACHYF
jgi:hypothetical protein